MDVIRNSNDEIIAFLRGYLIKKNYKNYRLNKFIVREDYGEVILLLNTLTGAAVAIRPVEFENIYTDKPCNYVDFLIHNYFLVPQDFDEDSIIDNFRRARQVSIDSNYLDNADAFTILTTTRCNARCSYCYQSPLIGKKHMTKDTAEKVADFIIGNTLEELQVKLDWFGGEPLFNKDIIEIICSRLQSSNRMISSSMISNGYLFDKELISHAKKYWNLTHVQITLDGTEEVYNNTKNYIYKDDPSPFKRIISNIKQLADAGIAVNIRLNVSNDNADNILELLHYLKQEFCGYREYENGHAVVTVYVWPLFELGFTRTLEEIDYICDKLVEMNQIIFENKLGFFADDTYGINFIHCMVDTGKTFVINPDGSLSICEHHIEDMKVGHIDEPGKLNFDVIRHWRESIPYGEGCEDCPLKPQCLRLPDCPTNTLCRGKERDYQEFRSRLGLVQMYENFLKAPKEAEKSQSCSCKCKEYRGN